MSTIFVGCLVVSIGWNCVLGNSLGAAGKFAKGLPVVEKIRVNDNNSITGISLYPDGMLSAKRHRDALNETLPLSKIPLAL
jgi:hypothetical protein